jgi:3-dehydroquinate synthase
MHFGDILEGTGSGSFYVFDENTAPLFGREMLEVLNDRYTVLPAGEQYKHLATVETVLEKCLSFGLARDSTIIAVGGGVVCDLTAFAASVYMRGCRCILIPTSLLSMVDAALGGKTGVDFGGYKNMVGTFYPAEEIRVCTRFLQSLPEAEYVNGLAEVIKHALLGNRNLWTLLTEEKEKILARDSELMTQVVDYSLQVKGHIVEEDFREEGNRAFLNLGHTFGHALETAGGFETWSHGVAVAWGIRVALSAGVALRVTSPAYAERVNDLLDSYGYPSSADADSSRVLQAMEHDKKKRGGTLRFVLQKDFGETFITDIDSKIVEKAVTAHLHSS